MSAAQLQTVFLRLVGSSARIIHIGCLGLLNVRPQDVRNGMRAGKLGQAAGAGGIHRQVRFVDVQAARIEAIPRQQQPGAAIGTKALSSVEETAAACVIVEAPEMHAL